MRMTTPLGLLRLLTIGMIAISSWPTPTPTNTTSTMMMAEARFVTTAATELISQNQRSAVSLQFEAEDGILSGVQVANNHAGFSGIGFADYGGSGSFTSWSVDIPTAGQYDVTLRYASANSRPVQLLLNDNVVANGQFTVTATGQWNNWQSETVTVTLPAGNGQILKILARQNPGPNVDFVTLQLVDGSGGGGGGGTSLTSPPSPSPVSNDEDVAGTLHVVLTTSERMDRNQFKASANGVYEVGLTNGGDLVVRNVASRQVVWSLEAETQRQIDGTAMWMQNDGNLVIRGAPTAAQSTGPAIWTSGTAGKIDAYQFVINNVGGIAVVLLFQNEQVVWSVGLNSSGPRKTPLTPFPTPPSPPPPPPPAPAPGPSPSGGPRTMPSNMPANVVLASGRDFRRNQFTSSPNGVYSVGLANDGRFILRQNGQEVWQLRDVRAGNVVRNADRGFMQSDGNLVLRPSSGGSVWNSETSNNNGAELWVDDGGRVSVVFRGTALWFDGLPRGTYIRGRPSSPDLQFPVRGYFYYAWYPETWSVNGAPVFFRPNQRGIGQQQYKSGDPAVVTSHIQALDYAWADLSIVSWFGPRHRLDRARITQLMDETIAQGSTIKWTVYHEEERKEDAPVSELVNDLEFLEEWFAWHPAWAHKDGKPVIFVYNEAGCEVADRWLQAANIANWYVNLKLFPRYQNCNSQPDSWHQYGVGDGVLDYDECTTIAPGFWRSDQSNAMYPRVGRQTFCRQVTTMNDNNRDWQLITSFNEWGEGTAVESAVEWQSSSGYGQYLDCLHDPVRFG